MEECRTIGIAMRLIFIFFSSFSCSQIPSHRTYDSSPQPLNGNINNIHSPATATANMGCTPSRPSKSRSCNDGRSFHHGPRYPQVPPGQMPRDCETCTAVNRRFQQKCSDGCTATRRSNLRPKWNPNNYPIRHSWEIYDLETPWQ